MTLLLPTAYCELPTAAAIHPLYSDHVSQALLLRDTAATLPTLELVFRWAIAQQPPLRPADVVIQDEYTHDVLFAGADGSWLVFDAT